jgi:FKBP-type peptidyl-prolyl cis-trans isomerase SlyD
MANEEMTVSDGMVVSLDYSLRLDDDEEVVDTSAAREPLEFVQGGGQIIPGLEQQIYGLGVGEEESVLVPPADGYGDADTEAYQLMPLEAFPADLTVEPGMGLELREVSSQVLQAYVADVRPDGILLDFNHPLAGKTLRFDVKITGLRQATEEELAHGHVHDSHEHEYDDEGEDFEDGEESEGDDVN